MSKITEKELKAVQEQEDLKVEMEKSYGKINIDLKDGSYTEIKEDEEKGENK